MDTSESELVVHTEYKNNRETPRGLYKQDMMKLVLNIEVVKTAGRTVASGELRPRKPCLWGACQWSAGSDSLASMDHTAALDLRPALLSAVLLSHGRATLTLFQTLSFILNVHFQLF